MVTTEQIEQAFNDSYEALLDAYETSYKPIVKEKVTKHLNDSDTQRLWQSNVITDPDFVPFYMNYYRSLLKDAVCDEELFRNLFNIDGDIDDLTEEEEAIYINAIGRFTVSVPHIMLSSKLIFDSPAHRKESYLRPRSKQLESITGRPTSS